ncbi:Pseudouridine synthase I, TruA, alpha/beta domain [Dillenia turbinata]|uniref:tRNA pseudouridine synthase n=1 Tax=Dillenia turbinata TaxID=194707 RepID=A0AAN8ZP95_9MAGN
MEKEEKVYVHYNHTDPFKHSRWTARESYQFMYDRPWDQVSDFYHDLVNCRSSFSHLLGTQVREFSPLGGYCDDGGENLYLNQNVPVSNHHKKEKTGRWARATFKIVLSYHGTSFDGWQKQPGLNTIQGLVESCLGKFVDEKKAQRLKDKGSAVEGCAVVAGRTDKGVTALCQVCSFYTWRDDVKAHDIEDAINSAAPGAIRVQAISEVPRVFHPNFCARWRRYFYMFPCNNEEERAQYNHNGAAIRKISYYKDDLISHYDEQIGEKNGEILGDEDGHETQNGNKPKIFSIRKVDQLLRQLEGKLLSYKMFARDTKASRNGGPPTECFIYHARATEARLPSSRKGNGEGAKVMCVELVGNRFLRKMVRVLVATSIREAAAGSDDDALISLMEATCRCATAPPAPPEGLCLVDFGYTNFDPQYSLIQ